MLAIVFCCRLPAQQAGPNLLQEALKYEGKTVTALEFEPTDQPLAKADLMKRVVMRVGAPFHEQDLRAALQNLYSSGRYADLAVDAREDGEVGVAVRFVTQRAYFIGKIDIAGIKDPPNEGQLLSALKLRTGNVYSAADKDEATRTLQTLLRQNGFYNADVQADLDYEPEWEEAHISFQLDPGKRAKFEQPAVSGNSGGRSTASILRATKWKRLYGFLGLGWQPFTNARLRNGLDNIRRNYEKQNLLQTEVTLKQLNYHEDSNTVQPVVEIREGAHVAVRVEGATIGEGKLLELVPMFEEHSIDQDLLTEGDHNIQTYLEARGYFEAGVSHRVEKGERGNEQTVIYEVDRGSRHKLVALVVKGNHYFPEEMIRERLTMEPARLPRYPYGRFNESLLQQDQQAIQGLYLANGFRDVKVTSHVEDNFQGRTNHLAVSIEIVEGRQWTVADLQLAGVAEADMKPLLEMITSAKNQVYSDAQISLDRENVLNYYYSRGYLNASFDYTPTAAGTAQVNLKYVVNPGKQTFVRNVLVTGLEDTDPQLVFDRMELKGGEPLSLAKEIDTQRRLYDLGIFSHVTTAIQNPGGDEESKYVLYDIDEAKHYSFTSGFGAQIARIGGGVTSLDNPAGSTGFSPRVALGLTRNNLFGLGQRLGLQGGISTIEQRGALTYFVPHFISNEKLSFTSTILIENSRDVRTYAEHRREGSIQLSQRLTRALTFQYRVAYRNISLSHLNLSIALVPVLAQPETAGVSTFSIIHDKRDDPTDAHHGSYTTLDFSYAPGFLGTQTHFARGLFRNSTYKLFNKDWVFARSTQFGLIQRTGGKTVATGTGAADPDSNPIPLAERIYAGGATSLRAFPDFQAGPRDPTTGFPVGGNALVANTFELRFPLLGDNLGGVLFHDAGNVYSSWNDVSFRFRQRNSTDFNYMVQSVGIGFRYRSVIGPIALDFSFSPNAPRFKGYNLTEQGLLTCSIEKNCPAPVGRKIDGFQFHFTLGQAF